VTKEASQFVAYSTNFSGMSRSRKMICSMHGKMRNGHKILVRRPQMREGLRNQGLDKKIMVKWILNNLRVVTGNKNSPTVTHACRKRRLKWVVTLPLGDINTEAWSSRMGLGVGLTNQPCNKENCWEASEKFSRILRRRPRPKLGCGAKERKKEMILNK
jgi:hypothetical protein